MSVQYLDLNTKHTLKHWSVPKAVIELVANALDEATESDTKLPSITWDDQVLTIQDYGRGLKKEHFQQNVNPTKHDNHNYIGKFGVGLKDALTVLYNKDKYITITSKYLTSNELKIRAKHGFEEEALHVTIQPPSNKKMVGTIITVSDITEEEYMEVKNHFQIYANLGPVLAETKAGKLYGKKKGKASSIYINGIKVNEESGFMYQYAIVTNTKKVMDAMSSDRDRNKITRTVYADKVQQILIFACEHVQTVRNSIAKQFNLEDGPNYDEFRYAKIKALKHKIEEQSQATPFTGEIKILLSTKRAGIRQKEQKESGEEEEQEQVSPTVKNSRGRAQSENSTRTRAQSEISTNPSEDVVQPEYKDEDTYKDPVQEEEEEEEEEGPSLPPPRCIKPVVKGNDKSTKDILFEKGRAMLGKLFEEKNIPPFYAEDESADENALIFTHSELKSEKKFLKCVIKKYIKHCLDDSDEETYFIDALVKAVT